MTKNASPFFAGETAQKMVRHFFALEVGVIFLGGSLKLLKIFFSEYPIYIHMLAVLAFLAGTFVGISIDSENYLKISFISILFSGVVYIAPLILIVPDIIDIIINAIKNLFDSPKQLDESGSIEASFTPTGRVLCSSCNFKFVYNGSEVCFCSRCGQKIKVVK